MPKKSKKKTEEKQWSLIPTFVRDGISERDYLLIISTIIFFFFVAVGLIMVLLQKELGVMYLSLLDMVAPIIMVVIGGYFGINITEAVVNRPQRDNNGSIVNVENAENVYEIPKVQEPVYQEEGDDGII